MEEEDGRYGVDIVDTWPLIPGTLTRRIATAPSYEVADEYLVRLPNLGDVYAGRYDLDFRLDNDAEQEQSKNMETTMQQVRTVITTTTGTYSGEWEDDPDNEIDGMKDLLEEYGIKALTELHLTTPEGTHYFNPDHVIGVAIESRPAQ